MQHYTLESAKKTSLGALLALYQVFYPSSSENRLSNCQQVPELESNWTRLFITSPADRETPFGREINDVRGCKEGVSAIERFENLTRLPDARLLWRLNVEMPLLGGLYSAESCLSYYIYLLEVLILLTSNLFY